MWDIRDFDLIMHEQFSELWDISEVREWEPKSVWSEYTKRIIDSFNPLSQDFPPIEERTIKSNKEETRLDDKQIQRRVKFMWF
jgi:hypothetical protein